MEWAEIALHSLDDSRTTAWSLATLSLGFAQMSQGAVRDAARAFREVARANRAMTNAYVALMATMCEAYVYRALGAWTRAVSLCEEAIRWSAQRSHPSPAVGTLSITLADLLRERGQLDSALEHVRHGISLCAEVDGAHKGHFSLWRMFGCLIHARIRQAQGDLDGALAVVGRAREQREGASALFAPLLDAAEAQVDLAKWDIGSAGRRLQRADADGVPQSLELVPLMSLYADEQLAIARVQLLLAQGRAAHDPAPLQRALQLIDAQRQDAEQSGFLWRHSKALALRALALQALGQGEEALAMLEQALLRAQPEGYVGLFTDEGLPMAALLRQLATRTW
jgi:LuxR family maltose regulon positive regulatory protein